MNNNSTMSRRPAGPVRQHSLQQPPPRRQQPMRRQRSSEDERNLQLYSTNSVASRNRYAANVNTSDHQMLTRPKVRVAWGDQPVKPKSENVEIVARQIPTGKSSRPTTGRGNRGLMNRCPLGEKATILYSRQELAERLRIAWRQREENKSNIDIFLAQNTVEERSDSRMSSATNHTSLPTPKVRKSIDVANKVETNDEETCNNNDAEESKQEESECKELEKSDDKFLTVNWFTPLESSESTIIIAKKESVNSDDTKVVESKNDETTEDEKEETPVVEKKSCISINCNSWNTSITISSKGDSFVSNEVKPPTPTPPRDLDYSQAKLKRASYQSGTNKAFVSPVVERPSTPRAVNRVSTPPEPISRYRRTSSAPPQRRTQVNIVIDTPGIATGESDRKDQPQPNVKTAIGTNRPIKSAPPVKRRSKAHKRRGLSTSYSKDGEDEDEGGGRGKTKGNKNSKSSMEARSSDVVTMVSLISSADSESEMDENSPTDDKLICELRNKLPTASIIKSSNGLSAGIRKPFKSGTKRKPKSGHMLSRVSFQQESFDYDSPPPNRPDSGIESSTVTRSSLQARFVALGRASVSPENNNNNNTPLLTAAAASLTMTSWRTTEIPAPKASLLTLAQQQQQQLTLEMPLTDREKRCLAVPIGDIHDKKRKLVRCRSAVTAPRNSSSGGGGVDPEKQSSTDASQSSSRLQPDVTRMSQIAPQPGVLQENGSTKVSINAVMPTADASLEKSKTLPAEPYCQTPKEKECWHLYRKMCDKGVFVSFDTVLRGMLTPTEYRLRQKEMSQNC